MPQVADPFTPAGPLPPVPNLHPVIGQVLALWQTLRVERAGPPRSSEGEVPM